MASNKSEAQKTNMSRQELYLARRKKFLEDTQRDIIERFDPKTGTMNYEQHDPIERLKRSKEILAQKLLAESRANGLPTPTGEGEIRALSEMYQKLQQAVEELKNKKGEV